MNLDINCPGYSVGADWYVGADASKVLIIVHGFGSTKARQRVHAEAMVQTTGCSALVIQLSGHGQSPVELGDTRPAQHLLELICAFDWLKLKCPKASISVSGSSYGGFLAANLSLYRQFDKLVLRAPAIYEPSLFYDLWSTVLEDSQANDLKTLKYRSDARALASNPLLGLVPGFHGRVLVVTHENDEVIPRQTTTAYVAAFGAEEIVAEGFNHTINPDTLDSSRIQEYQDRIADWLNKS